MSRTPLVVGNWKMNKTIAEAEAYVQALLPRVSSVDGVDFGVCPPFLALQAVVDSARGSQLAVYAQNMHEDDSGARTGEVSAPMLSEVDPAGVLLGHSERREHFGETDAALRQEGARGAGRRPRAAPLRGRDGRGARARGDRGGAAAPAHARTSRTCPPAGSRTW